MCDPNSNPTAPNPTASNPTAPNRIDQMRDILEAIMEDNSTDTRRLLGENILNHAESLLADGKVSDGQYLDFCNGAGLIHQGVMVTQNEAATLTGVVNTLCRKVVEFKRREVTLRKYVNTLQLNNTDLHKRYEEAKGTMFKNAVSLESAIQKKAYARARTMIVEQKKTASDLVYELVE